MSEPMTSAGEQETPELNTIPDPREPSPHATRSRNPSPGSDRIPDLSGEVAALSTKLVDAINHQTTLDDALQAARHEVENTRHKVATLEAEAGEHRRMLDEGMLVSKFEHDALRQTLTEELEEERKRRSAAENHKKTMELEVENLTASLFEEANNMVASARQEREAAEKRVEQMQVKLTETETLLSAHQEQLRNLKNVMQEIRSERSWTEGAMSVTAPSTPINRDSESFTRPFESFSPTKVNGATRRPHSPENPLHFTHLIQPVSRMDIQAFDEFMSLIRTNKQASAGSRISSGTTSSGIAATAKDGSGSTPSAVASPSLGPLTSSISATSSSAHQTTPGSFVNSPIVDQVSPTSSASTLKDSKFYKRSLSEDVEPTLRLETAPGLSWLARRSVLSSMLSGSMIVDPYPSTYKYYSASFACSLCGETRQDEPHIRRHRFRMHESEDAQRYPLCDYCLARLRSTCDFINFLRLVLRGHWRNESLDDCRIAWEECIRLKERMFWSRIGAGVIPVETAAGSITEVPALASLDSIHSDAPSKRTSRISNVDSHDGKRKEPNSPVIETSSLGNASLAQPCHEVSLERSLDNVVSESSRDKETHDSPQQVSDTMKNPPSNPPSVPESYDPLADRPGQRVSSSGSPRSLSVEPNHAGEVPRIARPRSVDPSISRGGELDGATGTNALKTTDLPKTAVRHSMPPERMVAAKKGSLVSSIASKFQG